MRPHYITTEVWFQNIHDRLITGLSALCDTKTQENKAQSTLEQHRDWGHQPPHSRK